METIPEVMKKIALAALALMCGIARKANASLDPSASRSRSSRPEELTSMRMKSASAFGSALLFAAAVFG